METALIRCTRTRHYVKVVLPVMSEDCCSNYRPLICPECMKVHFVRQKELECRLSEGSSGST